MRSVLASAISPPVGPVLTVEEISSSQSLSRLIRRFGIMPLVVGGHGLRQPVHVEDLAIGAISAAESTAAANNMYSVRGGETLAYREMVGRIFDRLRLPKRTVSVPPFLWRAALGVAKPLFP